MKIEPQELILQSNKRMIIRSANAGDAASMCRHRCVTSAETYFMARYPEECDPDTERMKAYLTQMEDSPQNFTVTAFVDNRIIGDLGVTQVRSHLKFRHRTTMGISVQASYCNAGLGSVLLEIAIDQARRNGFEQLELGVFEDNPRAIHLYKKFGFQQCGIQPRAFKLKDGTYRDEILMVKFL